MVEEEQKPKPGSKVNIWTKPVFTEEDMKSIEETFNKMKSEKGFIFNWAAEQALKNIIKLQHIIDSSYGRAGANIAVRGITEMNKAYKSLEKLSEENSELGASNQADNHGQPGGVQITPEKARAYRKVLSTSLELVDRSGPRNRKAASLDKDGERQAEADEALPG